MTHRELVEMYTAFTLSALITQRYGIDPDTLTQEAVDLAVKAADRVVRRVGTNP